MGAFSRSKGQRGERELAKLLTPILGEEVRRNLDQDRDKGNQDILAIPGLAIEVKRVETLCRKTWWNHLVKYIDPGLDPVLAFRQNRKPWRFLVAPTLVYSREYQGCSFEDAVELDWHAMSQIFVARVAAADLLR